MHSQLYEDPERCTVKRQAQEISLLLVSDLSVNCLLIPIKEHSYEGVVYCFICCSLLRDKEDVRVQKAIHLDDEIKDAALKKKGCCPL